MFPYLSNGLQALGLEKVYEFCDSAIKLYPESKIVSIGSGNSYFESLLEIKFKIKIICVEPDPNKFNPINKMHRLPDYDYTINLVNAKPKIVDNCILILNWCDPAYAQYDLEAVSLLKPKSIIWIGETNIGCASGYKFHYWLKHNDEYIIANAQHKQNDFDPVNQKKIGALIYSALFLTKKN